MNLLSRLAERALGKGQLVRPVTPPVFAWKETGEAARRAAPPLQPADQLEPLPPEPRAVRRSEPISGRSAMGDAPAPDVDPAAPPPPRKTAAEPAKSYIPAPAARTRAQHIEPALPADDDRDTTHDSPPRPAITRAVQRAEPIAELPPEPVALPTRRPPLAMPAEAVVASPRSRAPQESTTTLTTVPTARPQIRISEPSPPLENTVEISIGRIEVRGIAPEAPMAPPVPPETRSALSLSEYLNQRDRGVR